MKKKLAIISSYNESCGNASYTEVLKNSFAEHVEAEVIPLNLFLLQRKGKMYARHGDRHIDDIAKRLAGFDYVNIQFEAGLYGPTIGLALKRVRKLIDASKSLVLTMHRIDPPEMTLNDLFWQWVQFNVPRKQVIPIIGRARYAKLYRDVILSCARRAASANAWVAVHTRREAAIVRDIYGFQNVLHYPITFLREEERSALVNSSDASPFRQRHCVPEDVKVIGAFGFVSRYKGYETLIKALTFLPPEYHLYIFGGQHPQSVKPNVPLDPYFGDLFELIGACDKEAMAAAKQKLVATEDADAVAPAKPVVKMRDRVHFMGELSDPDFIEALRFSDFTVLPYLEVGQSMSGVISLAIESGANLFCSTNLSFAEVRKMYGDVYNTFDIGNYVELAQKMLAPRRDFTGQRDKAYREFNIRTNVRKHLEAFGHFQE